jgi:hypothetical protein
MPSSSPLRTTLLGAALTAALCGLAWERDFMGLHDRLLPQATPSAPTRVFIVVDNLRADYTSLCGFDHPTTPTLEALAARPGAQLSCRAYAPGSWTLPSHASFFTGLPVEQHGAHFLDGAHLDIIDRAARGLSEEHPTLAERFQEQGYQTLLISGNPVVGPESGLSRSFGEAHSSLFGQLEGQRFIEQLDRSLDGLDRSKPLLVFLNITDAHTPWDAVPEGHPWLAPQPEVEFDLEGFWQGTPEEQAALLAAYGPLYTWGVQRADDTLARSLERLEVRGWLGEGSRVVITSDHGEMLGEHGWLSHGRNLYEPNNHVFLLALGEGLPALPSPVNAMEEYSLTLDGTLAGYPVEAAAFPDAYSAKASGGRLGVERWAARWEGGLKWTWRDGAVRRYDLAADPGELRPADGEDAAIEALGARVEAVKADASELEAGITEMLRAAGYVE